MAAQFFNTIGKLGLGIAVVGGVVNTALYNGKHLTDTKKKRVICDHVLKLEHWV